MQKLDSIFPNAYLKFGFSIIKMTLKKVFVGVIILFRV